MSSESSISSRAAFHYPSFSRYMVARFLGTISSEMQSVAVGWQIYEMTHRALDLGLVGLAQFLPGICLFLIAGQVADRIPRIKILQSCYASFAVCSVLFSALAWHGLSSPWPLYVVLVLNGTIRAFNAPASQAILPLLVDERDFPNAVAWSASIFQTALVAGPLMGGLLYGITGRPLIVFLCAAVCYLMGSLALRRIALKTVARTQSAPSAGVVFEGIRYIFQNKLILGAISLDLFAVLLGGAVALLPVFAHEILHIGALGLGILRGAPAAGAVAMAIVLAYRPLTRHAGVFMFSCVFAFGIFTILFGISHSVVMSLVMLFLIGASDMISVIIRHTLIQLSTPDAMRGRVSAVNTVFISTSNEVGQFESGLTAHWFGTVPAVVLGGVGTLVIVLAWAGLFPNLRRVDRLVSENLSSS